MSNGQPRHVDGAGLGTAVLAHCSLAFQPTASRADSGGNAKAVNPLLSSSRKEQ